MATITRYFRCDMATYRAGAFCLKIELTENIVSPYNNVLVKISAKRNGNVGPTTTFGLYDTYLIFGRSDNQQTIKVTAADITLDQTTYTDYFSTNISIEAEETGQANFSIKFAQSPSKILNTFWGSTSTLARYIYEIDDTEALISDTPLWTAQSGTSPLLQIDFNLSEVPMAEDFILQNDSGTTLANINPKNNWRIAVSKVTGSTFTNEVSYIIGNNAGSGTLTQQSGTDYYSSNTVNDQILELLANLTTTTIAITCVTKLNGTAIGTVSRSYDVIISTGPTITLSSSPFSNITFTKTAIGTLTNGNPIRGYSTAKYSVIAYQYGAAMSSIIALDPSNTGSGNSTDFDVSSSIPTLTPTTYLANNNITLSSNKVKITAVDQRGLTSISEIDISSYLINYTKLTGAVTTYTRGANNTISATVKGTIFLGNLGTASNALYSVEYKLKVEGQETEWISVSSSSWSFSSSGSNYTLIFPVSDILYNKSYTLSIRLKDTVLNAAEETVALSAIVIPPQVPAFSWGKNSSNAVDFDFNVPANFNDGYNTTVYTVSATTSLDSQKSCGIYNVAAASGYGRPNALGGQMIVTGNTLNEKLVQFFVDTEGKTSVRQLTESGGSWSGWKTYLVSDTNGFVQQETYTDPYGISQIRVSEPQVICSKVSDTYASVSLDKTYCGKLIRGIVNSSDISINILNDTITSTGNYRFLEGQEVEIMKWPGSDDAANYKIIIQPSANVYIHSPGYQRGADAQPIYLSMNFGVVTLKFIGRDSTYSTWLLTGDFD